MTPYEILTICVAVLAVMISLVSLVRTRKTTKVQIELEKISARLAEKQLDKIIESEEREGQPVFVVRTTNIVGFDPKQVGHKVKITLLVENTGEEYLEPKHITLVSLRDGLWKLCPNAFLEHVDIREHDPILGERTILLKLGCQLNDCTIHISYVDRVGLERIQEFEIFPEGPSENLPFKVSFTFRKIYRIVPSELWKG